ncbi:BEN domain-containing protein 2 isoform X2 [Dasypus novemcinctus]|uniref:BEN domain-containing protein 2 isoform X2 n=1 Tax=Dasypus novemcinctus TaxID=9361 RepID=UPI000C81CDD8|nr:BEN domain-containing protein 2 isoform X2 [Dasypus novemcinctus]
MPQEQDYIVISDDDDSDNNINDDDVVIIEDSESEDTEDRFSTDDMSTNPNSQGSSDDYQQQPQISDEIEGLRVVGSQAVSQRHDPANLKRSMHDSEEMESVPLSKKSRPSTLGEEIMENNAPEVSRNENHLNELMELRHYCEALQEVVKNTNRQVNKLCGIVSEMQRTWGKPSGNCREQENRVQTSRVGTSLQSAACPEPPVLREEKASHTESLPLPQIISVHSLQSYVSPDSPFPGLAVLSYFFDEDIKSVIRGLSSAQATIALPTADVPQGESSVANNPKRVNYSVFLEKRSTSPDTTSSLCNPPNVEKVGGEVSLENSSETTNHPLILENDSGPEPASSLHSVPPSFEMVKAQAILLKSPETMSSFTLLENDSGQDPSSLSSCILLSFEMMEAQTSLEKNPETMMYLLLLENDKDKDTSTPSVSSISNFEMLDKEETTLEKSLEGISNPNLLESDNGEGPSSPTFCLIPSSEYLATAFPGCDLSEYGKNWKICVSDINSVIHYLCSEAKRDQKTVDRNTDPVNPETPTSADPTDKRDSNERGSLEPQQMAASEARANGDSQQNSNAKPGENIEPSTDNTMIDYDTLEYLGNPSRNVQIPSSVLDVAKGKPRPEVSARYLIRSLFTDQVLMKSNVYGSVGHGMSALNSNRINALREFLQDTFPTFDLRETGYDWKLCVTAMNTCIRSIRHELKKAAAKSSHSPPQPLPNQSEPRDAGN